MPVNEATQEQVKEWRKDFPILQQELRGGHPLVYLDNAATSQKPLQVIQALDDYYRRDNSNVHRGIHQLSERATGAYEDARQRIADFINAASAREIVYVKNTTEAINLVCYTWGQENIQAGDEILVSRMEHHSNLVPWQILAQRKQATIRYIPVDEQGRIDLDGYRQALSSKTKLVAVTQVSNMLGTVNPVQELARLAHDAGATILVDGAQSVPHMPVDVQAIDADFLVFSGHKMCGPTGIGVLYGKEHILEAMPPFMFGGEMIKHVSYEGADWNDLPHKFEAGTPSIAQAIGLGAAVDYLSELGMETIQSYEETLTRYAYEQLSAIDGLTIYGPGPGERGGLVSFTLDGTHPHDLASILDDYGIAIRAGHHCVQPMHEYYGINASARASFYLYNLKEEVDYLIEALEAAKKVFQL